MKVQYIDSFVFDSANYAISNGKGVVVTLKIDYKNNKYSIEKSNNIKDKNFQKEIEKIAMDLLKRKHAVNFAEK